MATLADGAPAVTAPPHDLNLEAHLLGAAMLDADAAALVARAPQDLFYGAGHKLIAEAIARQVAEGLPAEAVLVANRLERMGVLDQAGGSQAVVEVMATTPATTSAPHYAEQLYVLRRDRRTLALAHDLAQAVKEGRGNAVSAILDAASAEVTATSTRPVDCLNLVDWSELWDRHDEPERWAVDQVLAHGRGHALWAKHKQGKSLFLLWAAAELLRDDRYVPVYLDYEMTEADLAERLEDMGHGPESDLSRFHYALLPTLAPLDTAEGGGVLDQALDAIAAQHPGLDLVVFIDTYGRAVEGDENDADTTRAFFRHTGARLKRRGVTWVRSDHSGKDTAKGQRGSSAKGDDVDVVWQLVGTDAGVRLKRDASRMSWVPDQVTFARTSDPLRYIPGAPTWPAGTAATATILDELGVPLDATRRQAADALRDAGEGRRNDVVAAALRWRRHPAREER